MMCIKNDIRGDAKVSICESAAVGPVPQSPFWYSLSKIPKSKPPPQMDAAVTLDQQLNPGANIDTHHCFSTVVLGAAVWGISQSQKNKCTKL